VNGPPTFDDKAAQDKRLLDLIPRLLAGMVEGEGEPASNLELPSSLARRCRGQRYKSRRLAHGLDCARLTSIIKRLPREVVIVVFERLTQPNVEESASSEYITLSAYGGSVTTKSTEPSGTSSRFRAVVRKEHVGLVIEQLLKVVRGDLLGARNDRHLHALLPVNFRSTGALPIRGAK